MKVLEVAYFGFSIYCGSCCRKKRAEASATTCTVICSLGLTTKTELHIDDGKHVRKGTTVNVSNQRHITLSQKAVTKIKTNSSWQMKADLNTNISKQCPFQSGGDVKEEEKRHKEDGVYMCFRQSLNH